METQESRAAAPPQTTEPVARRLKRLRLAAGMSQRDLSSPGVSYAYISRIEAGARTPSVKALRKLAGKLGVTAEYLETGASETLSDQLLRDAVRWTDLVAVTVEPRSMVEGNPAVTVRYTRENVGERTIDGSTLTEALLEMGRVEEELDRLLEERDRIDLRLSLQARHPRDATLAS